MRFYTRVFGLKTMFESQDGDFRLACLEFDGSYLMIETGGVAKPDGKALDESSTKLRFNVANLEAALETVRASGIDAEIERYAWGSTINLFDPDGNRIGIRDEDGFKAQLRPQ